MPAAQVGAAERIGMAGGAPGPAGPVGAVQAARLAVVGVRPLRVLGGGQSAADARGGVQIPGQQGVVDEEVRLGPGGQCGAPAGEQLDDLVVPVLVLQGGDQLGAEGPRVREEPECLAQRSDGEEGYAALDAGVAEVVEGLGFAGPFGGCLGGAYQVLEPGGVGQGPCGFGEFGDRCRLGVRPQGPYRSGKIVLLEEPAYFIHGVGHRPRSSRTPAAPATEFRGGGGRTGSARAGQPVRIQPSWPPEVWPSQFVALDSKNSRCLPTMQRISGALPTSEGWPGWNQPSRET